MLHVLMICKALIRQGSFGFNGLKPSVSGWA